MRNEGGQFPIFFLRAIFNFNKALETYTATQIFQADITFFQKKNVSDFRKIGPILKFF